MHLYVGSRREVPEILVTFHGQSAGAILYIGEKPSVRAKVGHSLIENDQNI